MRPDMLTYILYSFFFLLLGSEGYLIQPWMLLVKMCLAVMHNKASRPHPRNHWNNLLLPLLHTYTHKHTRTHTQAHLCMDMRSESCKDAVCKPHTQPLPCWPVHRVDIHILRATTGITRYTRLHAHTHTHTHSLTNTHTRCMKDSRNTHDARTQTLQAYKHVYPTEKHLRG